MLPPYLYWVYASGFPKAKSCLKPSYEPVVVARKPGPRVLPLGVDECRIPTAESLNGGAYSGGQRPHEFFNGGLHRLGKEQFEQPAGRWPANVAHDGSAEVLEAFAAFGERKSAGRYIEPGATGVRSAIWGLAETIRGNAYAGDTGTAARFFYTAKASRSERGEGNNHPTVKPLKLMEWLVKLVCPEGGTVGDFFSGSGTTAVACIRTGRNFVGCEKNPDYVRIIRRRIAAAQKAKAAA